MKADTNLEWLKSDSDSEWLKEANFRFEKKIEFKESQKIALSLLRTIRSKILSKEDLRETLNVSPEVFQKILSGTFIYDENHLLLVTKFLENNK